MSSGRTLRRRQTVSEAPAALSEVDIHESIMPDDSRIMEEMLSIGTKVPEVVYASDGRKFYPCIYCCKAFALKTNLNEHINVCAYRDFCEERSSRPKSPQQIEMKPMTNGAPKEKEVLNFKNLDDIKYLLQSKEISIKPAQKKRPSEPEPEPEPEPETESSQYGEDDEIYEDFKCLLCNKRFPDESDLVRHKRHEHSYQKIKLPASELVKYDEMFKANGGGDCPLCHKPILNKGGWNRHLHTHDADVKHFCRVCKKGFYRLDHKKFHEDRHIMTMEAKRRRF